MSLDSLPESEDRLLRVLSVLAPKAWEELTSAERALLLAHELELEWSNGGFRQYFANPSGNRWEETLDALGRIGAGQIRRIFESALAVFGDSRPSKDQVERSEQLRNAGPTAADALARLDDEYFELCQQCPQEDSYAKMARFLEGMKQE
jgi:hypothetical protein